MLVLKVGDDVVSLWRPREVPWIRCKDDAEPLKHIKVKICLARVTRATARAKTLPLLLYASAMVLML
jgi:hypothetical protein